MCKIKTLHMEVKDARFTNINAVNAKRSFSGSQKQGHQRKIRYALDCGSNNCKKTAVRILRRSAARKGYFPQAARRLQAGLAVAAAE